MPKSDIKWAIGQFEENGVAVEFFTDYYDGDHPLLFATEKFRNTFGTLFQAFADNLCPAVVDAVADRLSIDSWDGGKAQLAEKLSTRSRLPRMMKQVFQDATKVGDSFVLVWPSPKTGDIMFWPHQADQMCIEYDEEDDPTIIVKAAKQWMNPSGYTRINLYYDGVIEKYVTVQKPTNGDFPKGLEKWKALPTVKHDWGMPVFHFGNRAEVGCLGQSHLKDVIPLQNGLNKSVCDMLVAGEFVAYPQRYATGLQVEVDEDTGKPKNPPFTPGVDRIWTAAGEVKFGEFNMADLTGFIEVQNSFRSEIARVSGTPTHFLNLEKTWPSGEALKVAEGRLIKTLNNIQTAYGPTAVDMMAKALEMDGDTVKVEDLEPVWAPSSPHNPLLDAETALVKQQVGVSEEQSLKELGYSDEKITEMQAANRAKAQQDAEDAAAAAMTAVAPTDGPTAFTRNGSPGKASKPAPKSQLKPVGNGYVQPKPRSSQGQTGDA